MSLLKIKPFSIDTVDTFTFGNANVTGNLISGNASLGNLSTANFFQGNGSLLTSLTGANVTGQVANAALAGTVYTNAQPNITSVGTLSGITATGVIDFTGTSNVSLGSNANIKITGGTAGYFLQTDGSGGLSWQSAAAGTGNANIAGSNTQVFFNDNGSGTLGTKSTFTFDKGTDVLTVSKISANGALLTNIVGANVDGNVTSAVQSHYANIANSVAGANVSGNVTSAVQSHYANIANSVAGANVSGNVTSAVQSHYANIANSVAGANVSGNVTSAVQSHYANIANSVAGANVSGQVANANVAYYEVVTTQTTGTFYPVFVNGNTTANYALGSNTALSFDAATGVLTTGTIQSGGGSGGNITGANLISANYFVGNGYLLTSTNGANVTGNVAFAVQSNYANIANSVAGANVSGNVSSANVAYFASVTANSTDASSFFLTYVSATGNSALYVDSTANDLTYQPSSGNLTAAKFIGNGYYLTGITSSSISGQVSNALIAGTVYTNAQPNITSTGTLLGLTVTGNVNITGNINATGNLNYQNVTDLVVGDPLIFIGANNTGNLYDLGFVASYDDGNGYHTGLARDASDGIYKLYDKVVGEPTTVIDFANGTYARFQTGAFTSTGNISAVNANLGNLVVANYFTGDGSLLTNLNSANIGNVGNANFSNTAGTVTTNAQPNITSVGTLTSLSVTGNVSANYFIGNGATLTSITGANVSGEVAYAATANAVAGANVSGNVSLAVQSHYANIANSVAGANVSGQVGNALLAGTVYTNAQPNITSVGTLTSLAVSGTTNLGNVANVTITGGSANYFLKTDGSGVLSFASVPTTSLNVDTYTGDGSFTMKTLTVTPASINYTLLAIGGVFQPRSAYSISGAVITFSDPPPNGAIVEVTTIVAGAAGAGGGGASALDDLTDVTITSPATNQVLKYNGSAWVNGTGGASWTYSAVSANTSAVAGYRYIVDTSSANLTITLPASGTLGDEVMIIDGTGNASTNAMTIDRNGGKIQGAASNMTVTTDRAAFTLVYYNSTQGWLLTNV